MKCIDCDNCSSCPDGQQVCNPDVCHPGDRCVTWDEDQYDY